MAKSRQVILMRAVEAAEKSDGMPSMGRQREVAGALARYNVSPDTPTGALAKTSTGIAVLYGPGLMMEMATGDDEVKQLMVTMTDDDFAFPVLTRLCREQRWTMMDPETGRRFGP